MFLAEPTKATPVSICRKESHTMHYRIMPQHPVHNKLIIQIFSQMFTSSPLDDLFCSSRKKEAGLRGTGQFHMHQVQH